MKNKTKQNVLPHIYNNKFISHFSKIDDTTFLPHLSFHIPFSLVHKSYVARYSTTTTAETTECLAASSFVSVDGRTGTQLGVLRGVFGRLRLHLGLDLTRHRHKSLFDIGGVLGRCLDEFNT